MSNTGATPEQIEAAARKATWWGHSDEKNDSIMREYRWYASHLVPPGHRIIGPEDVAALRRHLEAAERIMGYDADIRRLAALIGPDK